MSEMALSPIRRAWRRAPVPLRSGVNRGITRMAQIYGQLRGHFERGGDPSNHVCVMGMHRAVLGLGRGARLFYDEFKTMGLDTSAWDVSELLGNDLTLPNTSKATDQAATIVSHLNPIEHLHAIALSKGPRPKRGLRIGYWAWETSEMPKAWLKGISACDEIWCPSVFTAQSTQRLIGGRRPIRVIPYPMTASVLGEPDKARFGLCPEKIIFFSACDLRSSLDRKNPAGAIEAFRRSGMGARGLATLLVKLHGDQDGTGLQELKLAAAKVPGVTVLDKKLSPEAMQALRSSIDVVLSPHRSEGFGLVLAEAMQAAKPVIATGWSGNLDFMDAKSVALIDYKEVPVSDHSGTYTTGTWAEPDLDHAAHLIELLVNSSSERARLGQAGFERIRHFSDPNRWHANVRRFLSLSP